MVNVMHQSIPNTSIPFRPTNGILHLLSAWVPGFVPSELPEGCTGIAQGSDVLYIIKVQSCQLMPHEGTFKLPTDLPSICCSLVTKPFSKMGGGGETLKY